MENVKVKKIVTMKAKLKASVADHKKMLADQASNGDKCTNPKTCRWVVATYRSFPTATKVWVDAGHIRLTLNGWRWSAETPKQIKADLIRLDAWLHLPPLKRARTPVPFDDGTYTIVLVRGTKARKASAAELENMARRRRARIAAGQPDKPSRKHTFHDRVVGYA